MEQRQEALFREDVWCARQKPFTSALSALLRALTIIRLGFAIGGLVRDAFLLTQVISTATAQGMIILKVASTILLRNSSSSKSKQPDGIGDEAHNSSHSHSGNTQTIQPSSSNALLEAYSVVRQDDDYVSCFFLLQQAKKNIMG
jgi:hypothetical protein